MSSTRMSESAGAKPTADHEMQDGVAYAIDSPIIDERLDWLARHGSPQTTTKTEIRRMAGELWQHRRHAKFLANLAEAKASLSPTKD